MRLVEYLIYLLEAHSQTLQRLAALFGEESLLQMLEISGEDAAQSNGFQVREEWFDGTLPGGYSPYMEIESAVHDFQLSAVLEFHLWAYPHYRAFIESPLDLNSRIQGPGGSAGIALVDEAMAQAQEWVRKLPMHPSMSAQAERAAHVPWLRFRTQVLKRIGRRPMGPVY